MINVKDIEKEMLDGHTSSEEPDDENKESVEEESIYADEVRDELLEDDELSPEEAGFMEGYDQAAT